MRGSERNIIDNVRDFVQTRRLIEPGDRILLSLSAGKDSMALLDIMLRLKDEYRTELGIFHLNHCTRGDESDADERFLLSIASENNISIYSQRHDFTRDKKGESFEDVARKKRYELLHQIAEREGYAKIATAHTMSDNVETVFMRIAAGTGIPGLAGIEARRGRIIRPLLTVSSDEVYRYLEVQNIGWREDSTNADSVYRRNFVRHECLPLMRTRFTRCDAALAHLAENAAEHMALLGELLAVAYGELYEIDGERVIIPLGRTGRDERIVKYAVALAMREAFGEFVSRGMLVEMLKNMATQRSNCILYRNASVIIEKAIRNREPVLIISRRGGIAARLPAAWSYRVDVTRETHALTIAETGCSLSIRLCDYGYFRDNCGKSAFVFVALPDKCAYIILRNRRKGDRVSLVGGTKKLKDLFIENKLDRRRKDDIPIVVVDSRIAAVMLGVCGEFNNRIAGDFMVKSASQKILAICGCGK